MLWARLASLDVEELDPTDEVDALRRGERFPGLFDPECEEESLSAVS